MRFLLFDLKRIFSGKGLVLMCLLSPILVVLLFSTVVAPMIFTAKGLHFNLAICDEDKSEEVNQFINQMINSQALADIVDVYPVSTVDIGLELVEDGEVSVLIHIPNNFFNDLRKGEDLNVPVYATKSHSLESRIIAMSLNSSLSLVGKSQNVMEAARLILIDKGASEGIAEEFLDINTETAISDYMNRREVFGEGGTLSPLGEYLPVEYYLSAIFSIFAALSILPIIYFSAVDISGAILKRGLLCGMGAFKFFYSRILSGFIFILLVQFMLFPTSVLLGTASDVLGGTYANNFLALFTTLILSSLCYSSLALLIATLLPDKKTSLWIGFLLVLVMAIFCGALIPESVLPSWTVSFGKWLPMSYSMRMLSMSLFNFDSTVFIKDTFKILSFGAFFLFIGFIKLRRRGYK